MESASDSLDGDESCPEVRVCVVDSSGPHGRWSDDLPFHRQRLSRLYPSLTVEEIAAITPKLDAQNVPYKLDPTGTVILVPADRLAKVRVALAGPDGVPVKGGKGWEIFDESPLGMTPFVQNVNYLRALQAELARSIMELEPVASAKVMIARGEPSPFVRDQKPTTASVVLKLKPNATINRSTAAGINALVARSVEGLKPENVTIVDSSGRLLSDPHAQEQEGLPNALIEYRRELENHLASKAEDMLSRHLGQGRAIVRVSADINFQKVKEKSEQVSPEGKAIIKEQNSNSSTPSGGGARGVAGAASNVNRPGGGGGGGGGGGTAKEEKTETEYVVSKTIRELEDRMGNVKRLTIAALVDLSPDGDTSRTTLTINDVQEILKQTIGYYQGRDEIKVSDVKLVSPISLVEVGEEAGRLQRVQAYVGLARNVSLTVAVVVTVGLAVLILVRGRKPVVVPPHRRPRLPQQNDNGKKWSNLLRWQGLTPIESRTFWPSFWEHQHDDVMKRHTSVQEQE